MVSLDESGDRPTASVTVAINTKKNPALVRRVCALIVNRDVQVFLIIWTRTLVFICARRYFSFNQRNWTNTHAKEEEKDARRFISAAILLLLLLFWKRGRGKAVGKQRFPARLFSDEWTEVCFQSLIVWRSNCGRTCSVPPPRSSLYYILYLVLSEQFILNFYAQNVSIWSRIEFSLFELDLNLVLFAPFSHFLNL